VITVYCGYQKKGGRFKLTSNKDCLPPDIDYYSERNLPDMEAVRACVEALERAGFAVCADFGEWFYETDAA
jgi:hypothetical protein